RRWARAHVGELRPAEPGMESRGGKHAAARRQVSSDARDTRRGHPVDSGRTTNLPARKYEKTTERRRAPWFRAGRSTVRCVPQARERGRLAAEHVATPAERHGDLAVEARAITRPRACRRG